MLIEEGKKMQILVVAKKGERRSSLKYILAPYRYNTVLATNGKTALTVYGRTKPDLVIMDATLPGLDAPALIKAIREVNPVAKIIGMSHNQADSQKFEHFWLKTETVENLIALVIKLLPIEK
jgi:CheY-like chemotaxis protein